MRTPYHIVNQWSLSATPDEVTAILKDINHWPQWCPQFCLETSQKSPGEPDGIGQVFAVLMSDKRLSYCEMREPPLPNQMVFEFSGALSGQVIWTLRTKGIWTDVIADWYLEPWLTQLKIIGPLLKPFCGPGLKRLTQTFGQGLKQEVTRQTHLDRGLLPPLSRQRRPMVWIFAGGTLLVLLLLGVWGARRYQTKRGQKSGSR